MTREDQKQFVEDLTGSIARDLLADVHRVPETWDGHELREWIADRFQASSYTLRADKRRMREYRNAVLVKNL